MIADPGVKVDESYARLRRGPRARVLLPRARRRRVPQRRLAGAVCVPGLHGPRREGVVGSPARVLVDAGVAGVWCDMNEPAMFVPEQSTMPEDVVHPGGGRARLHAEVHNAYGSLMARGGAGRAVAAAAGRAAVRDLARRLRGAAAARAAVDGRQLVLVGAPVDEHAAAAEPRAVGDRVVRAWTSAGSSTTATASCSRAGPSSARSSRSAATTRRWAPRGRSRGRSASRGRASAGTCWAADAAAAVPVHGVRGVPPHGRADAAAAAVLVSGRPDDVHGRRRVPGRRCAARGADHAARDRAPARVPARGLVGALVDRRAHRRARHTCSRTRRWGSRPCMRGATRRSRCGPCCSTRTRFPTPLPGGCSWVPALALASLYEDSGDGYGPWCRRTAHVEEGWAVCAVPLRARGLVRARSRGASSRSSADGVWRSRRPGKPW